MGILQGKIALITGAGQGVGRGIALAMAREGAAVAVVDRNRETAAETVALIEDVGGTATFHMRACFPYLRDGGRVINLRSGTDNQSMVGYGAYVAAKAAVGGLTRAAAREWGRKGITVNALVPFALSPGAEADLARKPGRLEAVFQQLSIPRSADVEADVGRAAVFLAGPDATFITGCTLSVDGGGSFFA